MSHNPLTLHHLGLSFPHKTCFEGFSTQIHASSRIAIIGQNGSGKSTLLKMLHGDLSPTEGSIHKPEGLVVTAVPQVIDAFETLSGGQRLNAALTQALALNPDVLLLDEPTNHLDASNRRSLMRMLQSFPGTLIVVSHDPELLHTCVETLWHIEDGKIHVFAGRYGDYLREQQMRRTALLQELATLEQGKKETHKALMQEQTRAKNAKLRGKKHIEQRKWPIITSPTKFGRSNSTSELNKMAIRLRKEAVMEQISDIRLPEILTPSFSLRAADLGARPVVSIVEGACGYGGVPLLTNIHLQVGPQERVALTGDNGSGKTTLLKAILRDPFVTTSGAWQVPPQEVIGYLDQHYGTLDPRKSVLETIQELRSEWTHAEVRRHLNDFLFRKNEEVNALVETLSGGEKARLSLAQIAARTPRLLILDEVTNNLDLEARAHVIQVLTQYPGALLVVSHDGDFLESLNITKWANVREGTAS